MEPNPHPTRRDEARGVLDPVAPPRPIRVLVLEDVPADAELMLHELRRAGFAPEAVRVDDEADYIAQLSPDLDVILADYRLPQFDALAALDDLQRRGLDIPFIIVSGAISEEAAVDIIKRGAADYLLKDRMKRLGTAVDQALESKRRRTEKERAERALRESEERFRLLVEGGKDYAIYLLDPDGRVTSWNPGAERIYGWRADEILGEAFTSFLKPEDVELGRADGALETAATQGRHEEQGWRVRKDGTRFWADVVTTSLQHADGSLRGFSEVVRDISERRRAEETLARQAEELARSNAELEIFANVASHDLKEPLRAIQEAVESLERRHHGRLDADSDALLARTLDAASRMRTLIDDLLAYSRAHASPRVFLATDMGEVFETVRANLAVLVRETGARLTRGALPVVSADPSQMVQLLQNLLANALRHRADRTPEVHVAATREDGRWRFTVSDNGPGIEPQHAGRVFELFQRLHDRADSGGSGIGLAICKRIVERHGGTIGFESVPGQGTTFHFTLPAGPQQT